MKIKKHKPIIFAQDYGTYEEQVLVCSGATQKEIVSWAKKNKVKKEMIEWLQVESEDEAQAYLLEYLFREIRRKLIL